MLTTRTIADLSPKTQTRPKLVGTLRPRSRTAGKQHGLPSQSLYKIR